MKTLALFLYLAASASAQTFYPWQFGGTGMALDHTQCATPATNFYNMCPTINEGVLFTANGSPYASLVGPKGDKGDPGDMGPQGVQGLQGIPGVSMPNPVTLKCSNTGGTACTKSCTLVCSWQ